jgi:hypothetical protein
MALRVTTWTGDLVLLDLMRGYVQAANRMQYAERRIEVNAAEVRELRQQADAAAAALEDALIERGWGVPGAPKVLSAPRAAVSA